MRSRNAFTLVELLAVIGIIGILIGILIPTVAGARRRAEIAQCSSNLHNIGNALFAYAADNGGWLPQFTGNPDPGGSWLGNFTALGTAEGSWMWDMEAPTRDMLVRYGVTQKAMYCPSNMDTQGAVLSQQNPNGNGLPWSLWDFDVDYDGSRPPNSRGFAVLGFVWLTARYPGGGYPASAGSTGDPDYHWDYQAKLRPENTASISGHVRPPVSAETEIVMDTLVSVAAGATDPNDPSLDWGHVKGQFPQPMPSAHLYGSRPRGGNILFLDGHVDWRNLGDVHARVTCYGPTNAEFWW